MSRWFIVLFVLAAACATDEPGASPPQPATTRSQPAAIQPDQPAAIYFFVGDDPRLVPVADPGEPLPALLDALAHLLAGPDDPALTTAIPSGSQLLSAGVGDGIATVDLSAEFEAGPAELGARARLSQVVYTATRFPGVDAVQFLIDGEPTEAFGDEGVSLADPVGRQDFRDLQPAVFIDNPPYGGTLTETVRGESTGGEFRLTVVNAAGLVVAEAVLPGALEAWESFSARLPYLVSRDEVGALEAAVTTPQFLPISSYPVRLERAESVEAACSGGSLDPVPVRQELPEAVAATRAAIVEAAASCRFDELAAISAASEFFSFDFGGSPDPEQFWIQAESLGEPFTRRLIQLLSSPFVLDDLSDPPLYVWPSAFRIEPTEEDWAALEGIYDPFDIQNFREMGDYLGLRIGIDTTGKWLFAVSGD